MEIIFGMRKKKMSHQALHQFQKDIPRVNVWINGDFIPPEESRGVCQILFESMSPCVAWRVLDVVSQGTLATWFESAKDTYARGKNEHLVSRGRQRIDIDTLNGIVRMEKEFVVVTLESHSETYQAPKRLYLEFDCKGRRPVKSAWQHDLRDGVWVRPFV